MWKRVLASIGVGLSLSLILTSLVAVPASAAGRNPTSPDGGIFVQNSDVYQVINVNQELQGYAPSPTFGNYGGGKAFMKVDNFVLNCDDQTKLSTCVISFTPTWDEDLRGFNKNDNFTLKITSIPASEYNDPNAYWQNQDHRTIVIPSVPSGTKVTFDLRTYRLDELKNPDSFVMNIMHNNLPNNNGDGDREAAYGQNFNLALPGYNNNPDPSFINRVWGDTYCNDDYCFENDKYSGTQTLSTQIATYISPAILGVTDPDRLAGFTSNDFRYKVISASDFFKGPSTPEPSPSPTPTSGTPGPGPTSPSLPDPTIPPGPANPDIPDFENGGDKNDPAETLGDCAIMDIQCYFEVLFVPKKNIIDEANGIVESHKDRFPFNVIDEVVEMTNTIYDDEVACTPFTFDFGTFPGSDEPFVIEFTPCYPFIAQTSKSLTLYLGWAFCMVLFAAWVWRKVDMSFDA